MTAARRPDPPPAATKSRRRWKLFELAALSPVEAGATSMLALLVQSLREDMIGRQFLRNKIAGSVVMPRALRWLIYRLSGLRIDTPKVREDCIINNSHLEIGYGTSVNRGCYFEGSGQITIGARSSIGPECAFLTSHHDRGADGNLLRPVSLPISVGSQVWLGARVTVLPGAVIEDGCTVAAGAVVKGLCRAGTVYGGVPARPLVSTPRGRQRGHTDHGPVGFSGDADTSTEGDRD